jgi:hypothetical protein
MAEILTAHRDTILCLRRRTSITKSDGVVVDFCVRPAESWVSALTGLACATRVEGKEYGVANFERLVFHAFAYRADVSCAFMAENRWEFAHRKKALLENDVGVA